MVVCTVDDCDAPRRKREWCDSHYHAWRTHGDPLGGKYKWAPKADKCVVCDAPEIRSGRQFCSAACSQYFYRERRRKTILSTDCVRCGVALPVHRVDGRSVNRRQMRFCPECRAEVSKSRRGDRLAVHILAHFRGTDCGICGEEVDMSLAFPDRQSASIDHTVPLAAGGGNDVENLQVAHLSCDWRKQGYSRAFTQAPPA